MDFRYGWWYEGLVSIDEQFDCVYVQTGYTMIADRAGWVYIYLCLDCVDVDDNTHRSYKQSTPGKSPAYNLSRFSLGTVCWGKKVRLSGYEGRGEACSLLHSIIEAERRDLRDDRTQVALLYS